METFSIGAKTIALLDAAGPPVASEADALDLVASRSHDIDWVVVPKERLAPDFFNLRTGLLGAVVQKFINYRLNVAILGDISAEVAASNAFRDYVRETNRRGDFLFVADRAELEARLE